MLQSDPARIKTSLWKVQSFLDELNHHARKHWIPGKWVAIDKQTIGFKGRSGGWSFASAINTKGMGFSAMHCVTKAKPSHFYFSTVMHPSSKGVQSSQAVGYHKACCLACGGAAKCVDACVHGQLAQLTKTFLCCSDMVCAVQLAGVLPMASISLSSWMQKSRGFERDHNGSLAGQFEGFALSPCCLCLW